MKINKQLTKTITFADLKVGDLFTPVEHTTEASLSAPGVYIKTASDRNIDNAVTVASPKDTTGKLAKCFVREGLLCSFSVNYPTQVYRVTLEEITLHNN